VVILAVAAVGVLSAYLTARRIGGVDALWYAYMVRGVTDQIAAGHFPVPVGQGPFAYNGGVHPFRSAPMYPMLAAFWDVLTLGRLGPFALQHLVALTSAVAGALAFYVAASKIMPVRRWAALAIALLYLTTPAWLAEVVNVEDYMTYMAFAAMPLVLYGNARSVLESDGRGYVALGAGLSLIWMCHPPIAFLTCLATLFIQAGAAASRGFSQWRGLAACVAVFAVLSAYYFASMSELPRAAEGGSMASELRTILALALFFIGLCRCGLRPRSLAWPAIALVGAIGVAVASRPWLIWISCSAAFWIVAVVAARGIRLFDLPRNAFATLFVCALLGAAAAGRILGPGYPGAFGPALSNLAENTAGLKRLLRPLDLPAGGSGVIQLGWGLDLAILAGALSLFGSRPLAAKLFSAVSLGLVFFFVRVPLVSDFLVGYFPKSLTVMCGIPLALRLMPVIAGFSAMAGVLWLAALPASSRVLGPAMAVLAILAIWGCLQSTRFVVAANRIVTPATLSEDTVRPENVWLARYAYDLMHIPSYYCNNVSDPRLETRLLDSSGKILQGPMEAARTLEARGVRQIHLVCRPIVKSSWFDISPGFTVNPGEHVLLRFAFDPARTYNGYIFFYAEHAYREYHLPDSGLDKAFGIGGERTTVLSFWNTSGQAEHYTMAMSREAGNDLNAEGGSFADLSISEFDPDALPISLESLIPYRATVSTGSGGWLETFILFLPGYRAWIDGSTAPVVKSSESLAEIEVPPGHHVVELRYVGTMRLWLAAILSASGWIGLCVLWARSRRAQIGP
jgi:hypothetical protein